MANRVVKTVTLFFNESAALAAKIFGAKQTGYYWRVKSGWMSSDLSGDNVITIDSHTGSGLSHALPQKIIALTPHIIRFDGFYTLKDDDLRITTTDGAAGMIVIEKLEGDPPTITKSS